MRHATVGSAMMASCFHQIAAANEVAWREELICQMEDCLETPIARSRALKQGPKFSNILYLLEPKHFLDKLGTSLVPKHRCYQVASFRDDLFLAHGILGGAADNIVAFSEPCPVSERDLDDGDALWQEAL